LIEYPEFLTIFRFIERDRFREEMARQLFFSESDMISPETGEKVLSLQRFASICLREGLFTEEKQLEFLRFANIRRTHDHVDTYEQLRDCWLIRREQIKRRFLVSKTFEVFFKTALNKIGECLEANASTTEEKKEVNWMSYRLIEAEANRLYLEYHSTKLLASEIQYITAAYKDIFELQDLGA
jgi:hypothetical protein